LNETWRRTHQAPPNQIGGDLPTAAEWATQALTQTRTAVDELFRMAADLRSSVAMFTY
jgi:hypothetical protein